MMSKAYIIRNMQDYELPMVLDWAKDEGWNPGLYDAIPFYTADPLGFFVGELNGEVIAAVCAVNYDDANAFYGLYIVKKAFRGQGYGLALTNHCLGYAHERNIGLDGVLENIHLYERIGFKMYYKNIRFEHFPQSISNHSFNIKPLVNIDFINIAKYDRQCFPAPRNTFLKAWINQPQTEAFGYMVNGGLKGYGVIRRCISGYKIGPLFADNATIAEALFLKLQDKKSGPIYIDIPEINAIGLSFVEKYQLKPVFATARMYTNGLPKLDYNKIIAVTSFELG